MLAFFRSERWWLTRDQIYVKLLPHGEPVQITHDPRPKYALQFSPDGSRIAYTVAPAWDTYTVSPLRGEPKLLLTNAAGLTWLDDRRVLFSEISSGVHMGVVTATESRSEYRTIYFPESERGMAHFSYASPDRKWALVVEMESRLQPCRVIPMDGSSAGRQVGPRGKCTLRHGRQTGSGCTSARRWREVTICGDSVSRREIRSRSRPALRTEGVAIVPDGRSLITSIGVRRLYSPAESGEWHRSAY
jgi:hypothetical protein